MLRRFKAAPVKRLVGREIVPTSRVRFLFRAAQPAPPTLVRFVQTYCSRLKQSFARSFGLLLTTDHRDENRTPLPERLFVNVNLVMSERRHDRFINFTAR